MTSPGGARDRSGPGSLERGDSSQSRSRSRYRLLDPGSDAAEDSGGESRVRLRREDLEPDLLRRDDDEDDEDDDCGKDTDEAAFRSSRPSRPPPLLPPIKALNIV